MSPSNLPKIASRALLTVIVLACSTVLADEMKRRRNDRAVNESAEQPMLLTDQTKVEQVGGLFEACRKQMSMATLIPGLRVKAEGTYNDQRHLVATSVKFNGDDLEQAQAIQAGTHEVRTQAA